MIRRLSLIALACAGTATAQVSSVTANPQTGALVSPSTFWSANSGAIGGALAATYQPLDADLTAIAALATTTYGRSLLTQEDAAASRATLAAVGYSAQPVTIYSDAPQTIALAGGISLGGGLTTGGLLSTDGEVAVTGAHTLQMRLTGATDVTLPTSGTLATLAGNQTFTGNLTFSGSAIFTGDVSLDLAETVTFQRVNIGSEDFGWRYNPTGDGQVEVVFPGGTAAFYQTGTPAVPYMYFPGTVQADLLIGTLEGVQINADGLIGVVPSTVIQDSIGDLLKVWFGTETPGRGMSWADNGINGREPTPAASWYYPAVYVTDGGTENNVLEGWWRTKEALLGQICPSATASLDFPTIESEATQSLTITVAGASPTNTPTVHLGWSGALPAGVIVAQAYVSASNTVTVTVANITGSSIDPSALTCRVAVSQY
jgi:hypothetical protein